MIFQYPYNALHGKNIDQNRRRCLFIKYNVKYVQSILEDIDLIVFMSHVSYQIGSKYSYGHIDPY